MNLHEHWADYFAERLAATINFLRQSEERGLERSIEHESRQAEADLRGLERQMGLEMEELG